MSICEFCGGTYKNLAVHQRFCKAKKEALETDKKLKAETVSTVESIKQEAQRAKGKQEAVSKLITDTYTENEKIEEPEKFISDDVKLVEKTLGDLVQSEKVEEVKIPESETGTEDIVVLENLCTERWIGVLQDAFNKARLFVKIKLKYDLAHELVKIGPEDYRYPSDVFIELLRTHCESWEETREDGQQVFTCKIW